MDQNTILATVALVSSVGTAAFGILNHKRIRSSCCGKTCISSIDVEATSPKPEETVIPIAEPTSSVKVYKESMSRRASLPEGKLP